MQHNVAKVCSKLGEIDEARRRWKQIIDKAPDTDDARSAQKELDQLPPAKSK